MFDAIWIATALGLVGGVALCLLVRKTLLPRVPSRLAFAGAFVALLPALFLSLVVGGTVGGAWGEQLFGQIGLPASGVPVGLALGIAVIFALVVLGGAAIGRLIGLLLERGTSR